MNKAESKVLRAKSIGRGTETEDRRPENGERRREYGMSPTFSRPRSPFSGLPFSFSLLVLLMLLSLRGICQTTDDYIYQAKINFDNKDFKQAVFFYTKAIDTNPGDTAAWCGRARAEVELEDFQGAIDDYSKSSELYPKNADTFFRRAYVKFYSRDIKGAIEDFTRAIKLNPKYSEYYRSRGYAKSVLSDYKGAIPDYNMAIKNDSANAEAWYNRGVAKIKISQKESGCLDLKKGADFKFDKAIDLFGKYCQ